MSAPQPTPYPPRYASAVERTRAFVTRVLWTALPFGSLGLAGWVQALRVARRRQTARAWWWLVGLAGSAVVEVVLLIVVPSNAKGNSGTFAGGFVVTYIVTASVYNWRSSKGMRRIVVRSGSYPPPPLPLVAPTAWMPYPFEGTPLTPGARGPVGQGPVMPVAQEPDMAAEVQAELRELRGLLGGGDAQ